MSEYTEIEQPFLNQLAALGWQIVDQGTGIPQQPAVSLRDSFRQWLLPSVFADAVRHINRTDDGQTWLTDSQLDDLRSQLTRLMTHILKWRMQPDRHSRSWVASITDARIEIEGLLEDEPSLRRELPAIWDRCLQAAQRLARDETGLEPTGAGLTMADVFDLEYKLEGES